MENEETEVTVQMDSIWPRWYFGPRVNLQSEPDARPTNKLTDFGAVLHQSTLGGCNDHFDSIRPVEDWKLFEGLSIVTSHANSRIEVLRQPVTVLGGLSSKS